MEKALLGRMGEAEDELLIYVDTQIKVVDGATPEEAVQVLLMTLSDLVEKGVNIKILIVGVTYQEQLDQMASMLVDYPALSQVPFCITPLVVNTFDVIDGEKVLLKISNPINPSEYFAAIYVWQKFATELKEKFSQMWEEEEENHSRNTHKC